MTAPALLFRCDAGPIDGLGHLSRCLNLADALAADGGKDPLFVSYDPDGFAAERIAGRGYRCTRAEARAGETEERGTVLELLREAGGAGARPILVLDSKSAGPDYAADCRDAAFLVCLDDQELRDLPCDLLLNAHPWIEAGAYPASNGRTVLAGAAYNLVPAEAFQAARRPSEPSLSVLITLGGEDPANHTVWALRTFSDLLAPHAVTVVVGPAHPDPDSVHEAAAALPDCRIETAPASLLPLARAADVAVTAGGMTCYELAAARVAQAAIAVEDHQWPLVEALAARGCLTVLGAETAIPEAPARATLATLLDDPATRDAMAAAAAALLPRSGLRAVAAAIIEHYGRT